MDDLWLKRMCEDPGALESFTEYLDQSIQQALWKHLGAVDLDSHKRVNGELDTWLKLRTLARSYKNEEVQSDEVAMEERQGRGGK